VSYGLLAACRQSAGVEIRTITATISGTPADNNPAGQKEFLDRVTRFESLHPHEHIVGTTYTFDPANYNVRLAAGQAEDAFSVYLTEPRLLIAQHSISDITNLIKGWQYFDSFVPSFLQLVTGPDDRIYGIPLGGYALGILYNRSLFVQARLDPDKPPTTWDEFRWCAQRLSEAGVAGFAELSSANQGGWHFASWMYSIGADLQRYNGDKWTAVFNSKEGVQVLKLLKDMRFTDGSIATQPLLTVDDALSLMATGKVAMAVMAPDALSTLYTRYGADLNDFGLGPMPQNGGDATLGGGGAWVFNPKSAPEVLHTAFDWIMFSNFDLHLLEEQYRSRASLGIPIGRPSDAVFMGAFQRRLDTLRVKYATMPVHNYLPFTQAIPKLHLRVEALIEVQTMYHMIDNAIQAILTDPTAEPQQLLDQIAQQFQTQVLDNVVHQ
jgi:ABC-type glycerol-3-phosphate transport system substrate-binding protein